MQNNLHIKNKALFYELTLFYLIADKKILLTILVQFYWKFHTKSNNTINLKLKANNF